MPGDSEGGIKLLLTPIDYSESVLQRTQAAESDGAYPLRWHGLVDRLSQDGTGAISPLRPFQRGILLAWSFSFPVMLAALTGRPIAYLAWGLGHFSGLRRRIATSVLKRSKIRLVNDPRTAAEVEQLSGKPARIIPYMVDTEFFDFADAADRSDYLFCPSSNDRDAGLLCALARQGYRVVWMNNDPQLVAQYKNLSDNLEIVSRPSFTELRGFYQHARACILPLLRDIHAAGQTTALEAIACGAPVLVTAGRTADILSPQKLATVLPANDPEQWAQALERLPNDGELLRRRQAIETGHSPQTVAARLIEALRSAT